MARQPKKRSKGRCTRCRNVCEIVLASKHTKLCERCFDRVFPKMTPLVDEAKKSVPDLPGQETLF